MDLRLLQGRRLSMQETYRVLAYQIAITWLTYIRLTLRLGRCLIKLSAVHAVPQQLSVMRHLNQYIVIIIIVNVINTATKYLMGKMLAFQN
jgi:hypothetical protein